MSDRDFDLLFSVDKPIIFNFHGYPWLIHRLAYSRTNHHNMHVHGYREQGNINTPLELAIENGIDRFTLAMEAIKYVPRLQRGPAALPWQNFTMSRLPARETMLSNMVPIDPMSQAGDGRTKHARPPS